MTDTNHFASHEIVSRIVDERLGSWLMRHRSDGVWDGAFWVRITAADGHLAVVGDFDPTVFAYGPSDPIACVHWLGRKSPDDDYYPTQKASIGMGGRGRISEYDVDLARKELRDLLAEAQAERLEDADDDKPSCFELALQAGLDVRVSYDGLPGCVEIMEAILAVDGDAHESTGCLGRRTVPSVRLAVQALNRLSQLLDVEASVTP